MELPPDIGMLACRHQFLVNIVVFGYVENIVPTQKPRALAKASSDCTSKCDSLKMVGFGPSCYYTIITANIKQHILTAGISMETPRDAGLLVYFTT